MAVVLLALITLGIMILFLTFVVWLLYAFMLTTLGFSLIPIIASLFISGLSIGFFAASLLVYWGVRIEALVYMIGWVFAPFSGIYYSLDVLPHWAQIVARCLPMSYIFDTIRTLIETGRLTGMPLLMSMLLNLFYFGLALCMFKIMFEKSRREGLARLVS